MQITEVVCSKAVAEKLRDKHRIDREEVAEVLAGDPYLQRRRDGLYYVFGRTEAGRYLFVVIRHMGRGAARVVTARDMDHAERRAYRRR